MEQHEMINKNNLAYIWTEIEMSRARLYSEFYESFLAAPEFFIIKTDKLDKDDTFIKLPIIDEASDLAKNILLQACFPGTWRDAATLEVSAKKWYGNAKLDESEKWSVIEAYIAYIGQDNKFEEKTFFNSVIDKIKDLSERLDVAFTKYINGQKWMSDAAGIPNVSLCKMIELPLNIIFRSFTDWNEQKIAEEIDYYMWDNNFGGEIKIEDLKYDLSDSSQLYEYLKNESKNT